MNPSSTESTAMGEPASVIRVPAWIAPRPACVAGWLSDLLLVTKARANVAVVATALVGFALHADIGANWILLLHVLAGTALLAGGAAVVNQTMEAEFDRRMIRTRDRPIAAGRLHRRAAIALSAVLCGTGCLWLGLGVNPGALLFGGLALVVYAFAYTPLKRRTPACTLVGAFSGALPLLVGWAATDAAFGLWASVAFAVLFLWQMPHFLAIAWWRRAEYVGAGYHVLRRDDHRGWRTAGWALAFTITVSAVSLAPAMANRVTLGYTLGASVAGILFLLSSIRFLWMRNGDAARSLFVASLYYLPAIYALMLLCRKD